MTEEGCHQVESLDVLSKVGCSIREDDEGIISRVDWNHPNTVHIEERRFRLPSIESQKVLNSLDVDVRVASNQNGLEARRADACCQDRLYQMIRARKYIPCVDDYSMTTRRHRMNF